VAVASAAPRSRQITMPAPHHSSFFTGRMPFLLPNQQRQSTEGTFLNKKMLMCIKFRSSKLPFVRLETPASVIIGTLGMSPFIAVPEDYHTNIPHQN